MESTESRYLPAVVLVGVLAAMAPHFFFGSPLQLHLEGNMKAWLGIAVWAPAVLAGLAFFNGVEFSGRVAEPRLSPWRPFFLVMIPVVWVTFLGVTYADWWTDMGSMRPWNELQKVLPMHAGLAALQVLFWQGIVQERLGRSWPAAVRVGVVTALNVAVVAPFVLNPSTMVDPVQHVIVPVAIGQLLIAILAELGLQHRTTMIVASAFGGAWIWFQQALLL